MLYGRRKRLADIEAREALGEAFWTETFEKALRVRIIHFVRLLGDGWDGFTVNARQQVLIEEGRFFLFNGTYQAGPDFEHYLLEGPDEMMPTLLEALYVAYANKYLQSQAQNWKADSQFQDVLNVLLREHRVSFEMSGGEMIPLSSMELHAEVVMPTLMLLGSVEGWEPVERSYRAALAELSKGDPADAVTDAGTALQEALIFLGAQGNALGPLIKSARQKRIINSHDEPLAEAIQKVANWVSADRSTTGDAHNATPALVEDAWFVIHVVGALILRLSKGTPRG